MATLFKSWRSCPSPLFSSLPPQAPLPCVASGVAARHCATAALSPSRSGSNNQSWIAHNKRMDNLIWEGGVSKARRSSLCVAAAAVQTAAVTAFTCETGEARPLGASPAENGINFALFSQHATSVSLCM